MGGAGGHATPLHRDAGAPVVRVTHRWRAGGVVELQLESTDSVGHSVPTGDVFRTLVLELTDPADGATAARVLLRRELAGYRHADGVVRIAPTRDRRVPPPGRGPLTVRVRVGGEPRPMELRLTLHRVASSLVRAPGATVSDPGRVIHRATLAP